MCEKNTVTPWLEKNVAGGKKIGGRGKTKDPIPNAPSR
jgi:hypothetical protein